MLYLLRSFYFFFLLIFLDVLTESVRVVCLFGYRISIFWSFSLMWRARRWPFVSVAEFVIKLLFSAEMPWFLNEFGELEWWSSSYSTRNYSYSSSFIYFIEFISRLSLKYVFHSYVYSNGAVSRFPIGISLKNISFFTYP